MSGTGHTKDEAADRVDDAPIRRSAQIEREAAAAIAELSTASLLDALEPEVPPKGEATKRASTPPAKEASSRPVAEGSAIGELLTPTPTPPSSLAPVYSAFSESVTKAFEDFTVEGGDWTVELSVPHVASKDSAGVSEKPPLHHLRLRPRDRTDGRSTIVAGTVNRGDNRAELRDYDHVAVAHQVRFQKAFPISVHEWERLLRKVELVLNASDVQSLRTPPTRELLEQRRSMQRISKGAITILIVVLLLATVVAWRVAVALIMSRAG